MSTASVAAGVGRDPYYLGPQKTSQAVKLDRIAFVPATLSLATPKVAVSCLLERLLNPLHSQKWRKVTLYTLSVSCIIKSLSYCPQYSGSNAGLPLVFGIHNSRPDAGIPIFSLTLHFFLAVRSSPHHHRGYSLIL